MRLLSPLLLSRIGWTTGTFSAVQAIRLGTNIILAWLLSPELFGMMLIINTLRTGIDLLTNVGFYQNVVASAHAEKSEFLNTAWTMQGIRGVALFLLTASIAYPLQLFYEQPDLAIMMAVAGLYFIFTGFNSVTRFLLQRRLNLRRLGLFELNVAVFSAVAHIGLALVSPTIWALVIGGVLSSAWAMLTSFLLIPEFKHRFTLDRQHAYNILSFGKWIFFASMVFFIAANFDRLYMGKSLPLALVGIYGIARSFAEIPVALVDRFGGIIFPLVSTSTMSREELRAVIGRSRPKFLLVVAVGIAFFISISDLIVKVTYDERYHAAAWILPALLLGVWFSTLSTLGASILMGVRRPAHGAIANAAKLAWLVVALPYGIAYAGMPGAIAAIVGADLVGYLAFTCGLVRERLAFFVQDTLLTAAMICMAATFRILLQQAGWADQLLFGWM